MRKSSGIVALLGLLSTALFAACHPVLGKPAIVGASASSGVGARVPAPGATDQDRRTVPVDLEAVYECVVTAGHQPGVLLATGLVASDPTRYTQEQIDIAVAEDPTCVIALDVLFWPAHQALPEEVLGTEEEDRLRLASVTSVLQMLEAFDVPVVLGLIPAIDHEEVGVVTNARTPSPELLITLNEEVRAWASSRETVVLVDFGQIVEDAIAARSIEIAGNVYDGETARSFVQKDNLHPTAAGMVVFMHLGCAALEERGLIAPGDWERDLPVVLERLPRSAQQIASSRELGLFGLLALERQRQRFCDARERGDCEAALKALDEVFTTLAEQPSEPEDWDLISLLIRSELPLPVIGGGGKDYLEEMHRREHPNYRNCFAEIQEAYRRQVWRLHAEVNTFNPDPWKFELWYEAMSSGYVQQYPGLVDRFLAGQRDDGGWDPPFKSCVLELFADKGFYHRFPDDVVRFIHDEKTANWLLENLAQTERTLLWRSFLPDSFMTARFLKKHGNPELCEYMIARIQEIAGSKKYDAYRERRIAYNTENNRTNWVPPARVEAVETVHVEAVAQ